MEQRLKVYDLMEKQQREAKAGCSGMTDNLLIDRTVTIDCHRHKRNLSIAWADVRKAYDSVGHGWLNKIISPQVPSLDMRSHEKVVCSMEHQDNC